MIYPQPRVWTNLGRSKGPCRRLLGSRTVVDLLDDTILEAARELSATLLSYRLYLEPRAFEALHDFKRGIQDVHILCDRITRRATPVDLTPDEMRVLSEACGRVVHAFVDVDRELGAVVRAPAGRLS